MEKTISRQSGWAKSARRFTSATLAFVLVIQALGPGIFAVQTAFAVTPTTIFSDSFGISPTVFDIPAWEEEGNDADDSTLAKAPTDSGADTASPDGGRFAKIFKGEWICKQIDASGYESLALSYYWRGTASAEPDDFGIVEIRANGVSEDSCNSNGNGGWTNLASHLLDDASGEQGQTQEPWVLNSVNLPQDDDGLFLLRFRTHSSAITEYFRVDGVSITGEPIPAPTVTLRKSVANIWLTPGHPEWGTHITYNIDWSVDGDVADLVITDELADWTYLISANPTYPIVPTPAGLDPLVWDFDDEEDGAYGTIEYTIEVSDNKVCSVENTATANYLYGNEQNRQATSNTVETDVLNPSDECLPPPPEPAQCVADLELIKNGSFENPSVTHSALWETFDSTTSGLDWVVDWMSNSSPFGGDTRPVVASLELHGGVNSWLPDLGEQYAELDGDWEGPNGDTSGEPASTLVYQDIPTVPGENYELKFSFSPRPDTSASNNILGILWGGVDAMPQISDDNATNQTEWTDYTVALSATSALTRLQFEDRGTGDSLGTFLDNVSLKCVPEVCIPSEGMISSDEGTTVTNVVIGPDGDLGTDYVLIDYSAELVSTVPAIQALGSGVWGASTSDASAKWIWSEDTVEDWTVDKWSTFQETFNIVGTSTSAKLEIAADNSYEVWVNDPTMSGVPDFSDALENNHSVTDVYDNIHGLLQDGQNTLTIRVKNWALPGQPSTNNPGGLLYTLSWGVTCGNDNGGGEEEPDTLKVHILKYLDGELATTESANGFQFPMHAVWHWIDDVVNSGNGDYFLGPVGHGGAGPYQADTSTMTWPAEYQTWEITTENDTEGSPSLVLPGRSYCTAENAGAYYLAGYKVGETLLGAENSEFIDADYPAFNNLGSDRYVIVYNETCPPPPQTVLGDVTMCKLDDIEDGNPLSGWQLLLLGAQVQAGLSVDSASMAGADSVSLDAGTSYVAKATGTWNNQGGANPVDAEYSTVDGWTSQMDGYTGYPTGILELQIAQNPLFGDWGAYNANHTYWQGFSPSATGTVNFRIFDGDANTNIQNAGWYGDNSGSLLVDIYEGYTGVTGQNGCVTFENVPFGDYTAEEVLQEGWSNVSGTGPVVVNDPTETFNIVNTQGNDSNPLRFTLNVFITGEGEGTVAGDGIDCSSKLEGEGEEGDCSETYDSGENVNLTANPDEGSNFDHSWSNACTGNNPLCSIVMDSDKDVQAHFDVEGNLIIDSVTNTGGGGGGGSSGDRVRGFSLGGGSGGGSSPSGEVLGASTELPGLPNTGNGPVARADSQAQAIATILVGLATLAFLNFTAVKVFKLNKISK